MLKSPVIRNVCLTCRLRLLLATRAPSNFQYARSKRLHTKLQSPTRLLQKPFSTSSISRSDQNNTSTADSSPGPEELSPERPPGEIEQYVRAIRQQFGDTLPRDYLSPEEYQIYERLYGTPILTEGEDIDVIGGVSGAEAADATEAEGPEKVDPLYALLREGENGEMEEVEYFREEEREEEEEEEDSIEDFDPSEDSDMAAGSKKYSGRGRGDAGSLFPSHEYQDEELIYFTQEAFETEELEDSDYVRTHPLTAAGKFTTWPSTIHLPKDTFIDPIRALFSHIPKKHISESALRTFGGPGLPHSGSTFRSQQSQQRPIPLDASQSQMSDMESNLFMAAVMPGTYASVLSSLIEVRKRLGSKWMERLLLKEGGPVMLDAGAGGAAVVAWREALRAEWERMHEGAEEVPQIPYGKSVVLTGSDALRHRASRFLDDTTFLPRLPDTILPDTNLGPQPRKVYDIIIAPHTLWRLREDYTRKQQVQKLWSLLNPSGGVLILLEKGVPRGFEVIAGARALLLNKHISSPGSTHYESHIDDAAGHGKHYTEKETGMIIAPCTNHVQCPMYKIEGVSKGRKDFCYFNQRFIRPPYLQRIFDTKDKNHEDVQFSYLAVQRGRDQRIPEHDALGQGVIQGDAATASAFAGHEFLEEADAETENLNNSPSTTTGTTTSAAASSAPSALPPFKTSLNTLSLPRAVLPPLKRRGHVILDLCTPSGTIERWTVPRSFSKQAFRDARKAKWGDLWALGAKTRIPRTIRLGKGKEEELRGGGGKGGGGITGKKAKAKGTNVFEVGVGLDGRIEEADIKLRRRGRDGRDRKSKDGRKGRKGKIDWGDEE